MKRKEKIPTEKELRELCREWQKTLRLQDWRVRIRYSKEYELDGSQAMVTPTNETRSALIRINPYSASESADESHAPIEVRVIHELVHLHAEAFWPKVDKDSLEWNTAEAAVDSIAWALYRAKYGDTVRDDFTGE